MPVLKLTLTNVYGKRTNNWNWTLNKFFFRGNGFDFCCQKCNDNFHLKPKKKNQNCQTTVTHFFPIMQNRFAKKKRGKKKSGQLIKNTHCH